MTKPTFQWDDPFLLNDQLTGEINKNSEVM
jgi:hypothetical protein